MSLTDTAIRNAKPGDKPIKLFDERGLYLEVSPTGGKWWRLKDRFASKEKRLSLGVYPDVSLKDALGRRDAARKLLADGIDPSENRKVVKAARTDRVANSFEVVGREWFARRVRLWYLCTVMRHDGLAGSMQGTCFPVALLLLLI